VVVVVVVVVVWWRPHLHRHQWIVPEYIRTLDSTALSHEDVWGRGGGIITRLRWLVSLTPRPLYPRWKSSWYPSDGRLGRPHGRTGRCEKEKNYLPEPVAPKCRCSVVGITTDYRRDDRGAGVRIPVGLRIVRTVCCPMDSGRFSSCCKAATPRGDQTLPISAEVKKTWIYSSTPHTSPWRST
jgi:hypothetical protein